MCRLHAGPHRDQKRVLGPLELKLQACVSCQMWPREPDLGSSGRATTALYNCSLQLRHAPLPRSPLTKLTQFTSSNMFYRSTQIRISIAAKINKVGVPVIWDSQDNYADLFVFILTLTGWTSVSCLMAGSLSLDTLPHCPRTVSLHNLRDDDQG